MNLLALLGIVPRPRYRLPSLIGRPDTNHNRVRQIQADIDSVIREVCITPDPCGAFNCPDCGHSVAYHDGCCSVTFRQTDKHGIRRDKQCFCLMSPGEIEMNLMGYRRVAERKAGGATDAA